MTSFTRDQPRDLIDYPRPVYDKNGTSLIGSNDKYDNARDITAVGCHHVDVKRRFLIGPFCAPHLHSCVSSSFDLQDGSWMTSMQKGQSETIIVFCKIVQ